MKLYCTFEMDINPGVWASDAHCKLSTYLKHPLGEQCSLNGGYFKLVSVFSIKGNVVKERSLPRSLNYVHREPYI